MREIAVLIGDRNWGSESLMRKSRVLLMKDVGF